MMECQMATMWTSIHMSWQLFSVFHHILGAEGWSIKKEYKQVKIKDVYNFHSNMDSTSQLSRKFEEKAAEKIHQTMVNEKEHRWRRWVSHHNSEIQICDTVTERPLSGR